MAGKENLVPMNEFTAEKQRAVASAGGKASGVAKRARKTLKQIATEMLASKLTRAQLESLKNKYPDATADLTVADMATLAQVSKAINGDLSSLTYLRDTSGEKPTDVIEERVRKVFVTEEEKKEVEDHIDSVIRGD